MRRLAVIGLGLTWLVWADAASADELQAQATVIQVFEGTSVRKGVLNPGNILDRPAIVSESALIAELRWRGFNGRLRLADELGRNSGGWRNDADVIVQEAAYEADLPPGYRLSLGKLSETWHVGYGFHPLGFFEPELNRDDLSERFKRSEGLPAIVAGYLGEGWDVSLAYSDDFEHDPDGFNRGMRQWGARLGMLNDNGLETALVVQQPEHQKVGFGGSAVMVFGQALEVHGALFVRQGTRRPLHRAVAGDQLAFFSEDPYRSSRRRDDQWYWRSVLGLQWTSDDLVNVLVEWGHDERGLDQGQWNRWKNLVRFHADGSAIGVPAAAVQGNLKYDARTLLPTGTRQDYLLVRLTSGGGDWVPEASVLLSLADASAVWQARMTYVAASTWEAELFGSLSSGSGGSEFGIGPRAGSLGFALRYFF